MSGQMIIVYVIGVAVGAYLVYRIYRAVAGKRRGGGCPNCCSGGQERGNAPALFVGIRYGMWRVANQSNDCMPLCAMRISRWYSAGESSMKK